MKLNNLVRKKTSIFLWDMILVIISWYGANLLRSNVADSVFAWKYTSQFLPFVLLAQAFSFRIFKTFIGIWRYTSTFELIQIIKSVFTGGILSLLFLYIFCFNDVLPRSMMLFYVCNLNTLMIGSRLISRYFNEKNNTLPQDTQIKTNKNVLVIGAGKAGEGIIRDMLRSSSNNIKPVVILDDDQGKHGKSIHGVMVVGFIKNIKAVIKQYAIEHIVLAIPSASESERREILKNCEQVNILISSLPSLKNLVHGKVFTRQLEPVSIEEILEREPVELDTSKISILIAEKVILVTGAGGSIGSEVCRQIAAFKPDKLILVDHSEYNLFKLAEEFSQTSYIVIFEYVLIDIRDEAAIRHIFLKYQPKIIFHAAAYKHVPLLQSQMREAVSNNIIATNILASLAVEFKVEQFIMVSTDKAVRPPNYMGASKFIAEKICQYFNQQSDTKFMIVRFGNVLGSRGSVVPTFEEQIAKGGPVTITHPDITRYFMTIKEAAQLILQAAALGHGGEVFVLDMGKPIKISQLAAKMIALSEKKLDEDIEIQYIGLRPGEKLYEELFYKYETLIKTSHDKIMIALSKTCRENDFILSNMPQLLEDFKDACCTYDINRLRNAFKLAGLSIK